jgi:hypothetical protein
MASITIDQIVDRVRSICVKPPFAFVEAVGWDSFDLVPSQTGDGVFRIPPPSSQRNVGFYSYIEDRTDSLQLWLLRRINNDYTTVRRTLLRDMHSLTSAVIRDALQQSGDYVVPDDGRGHSIGAPQGKDYAVLRLTLPVQYETQL